MIPVISPELWKLCLKLDHSQPMQHLAPCFPLFQSAESYIHSLCTLHTLPNCLFSLQQKNDTMPSQVRNYYKQKNHAAHIEKALAVTKAANLHSSSNVCVAIADLHPGYYG
jgi:hypothetical protein